MGKIKEQQSWYHVHERELDQMVSEVVIYCVSELVSDTSKAFWKDPDLFDLDEEQVINIFQRVDESFEEDGAEPTYIEALQHFVVADWFADELEKRGEIVDKDFLGLTVWGRPTYGQAISLDYVVQDILKDIVERRKANG